jgi:putative DNA primase/helicase
MRFDDFASLHGLIVGPLIEGRWVRVPTVDHPKKRNGAYKFLGDVGFVQNHATSPEVSVWRPENAAPIDTRAVMKRAAEHEREQAYRARRAADRAEEMLRAARPEAHGYLQIKGLPDVRGLTLEDGSLVVPMREYTSNELVGAQVIRWLPEERRWEKKMLSGMRAKGAVFRIGPTRPSKTILCEGYATGLSIELAAFQLRMNAAVLVCFSDSNMVTVAPKVRRPAMVFADNDASGAGERAAKATGLPYCMGEVVGEDANDIHKRLGLFSVCALLSSMRGGP